MPDFESFLMRHNEFLIQSLIEQIERNEGIPSREQEPLEERWASLMRDNSQQQEQTV